MNPTAIKCSNWISVFFKEHHHLDIWWWSSCLSRLESHLVNITCKDALQWRLCLKFGFLIINGRLFCIINPYKLGYHWPLDWYLPSDLDRLSRRWLVLQHWLISMAVIRFKMGNSKKMIKLCRFWRLKFSKIHQGWPDFIFLQHTLQHFPHYRLVWIHLQQFSSNRYIAKK